MCPRLRTTSPASCGYGPLVNDPRNQPPTHQIGSGTASNSARARPTGRKCPQVSNAARAIVSGPIRTGDPGAATTPRHGSAAATASQPGVVTTPQHRQIFDTRCYSVTSGSRVRVSLRANEVMAFDRRQVVARHARLTLCVPTKCIPAGQQSSAPDRSPSGMIASRAGPLRLPRRHPRLCRAATTADDRS
jgi:hypothetical protein